MDLEALVRRRSAALVAGDVKVLNEILSDDFIYTDASGNLHDKSNYLASYVGQPQVKWLKQDLDDIAIRVFRHAAVITCRVHDKALFGGILYDAWLRATFVYIERDTVWQCVTGHSSRIEDT